MPRKRKLRNSFARFHFKITNTQPSVTTWGRITNLGRAFERSDQNENTGDQSNQINDVNERTEIESETKQAVDDDIESEQNHSEFLHGHLLQRFQILDQILFLAFG
jgi:hypothetical protein